MSLHLIPGRRKQPRHSADVRIAELQAEHEATERRLRKENVKLLRSLAAADEFFMEQDRRVTALEADLAAEKRARTVAEADVAVRDRWIADLQRELADARKRMKVSALAETAATETQEIDPEVVAQVCGRPIPLYQAPFATTDPGRVNPPQARL
ncbi:hypothetical protein [Streptomyces sp. B21-101]|uniref:hypothetical protein n=1 Tax=Streptomyces sp. B21-101 TaxID=3039415 RepID=UPI002FF229B4